jgi:hypothetical protein
MGRISRSGYRGDGDLRSSPAQVDAHALGRNVAHGVIQRLHVGRGDLEELRVRQLVEGQVTAHREIRTVDLERHACARDRVVLLLHDVHEAGEIRLSGWIVLVPEKMGNDTRRGGGHEALGGAGALEGGLKVGDVPPHRLTILPLDGPGTGGTRDGGPRLSLGRLGEVRPVGAGPHQAGAVEAGEPVADIGRIAHLALLAVAHEIHAGRRPAGGRSRHRRAHPRPEGGGLGRAPRVERLEGGGEIGGAGQAPRVGGEDAVGAVLHRALRTAATIAA